MRQKRSAFTLIELLVVMSIIVLLLSILMPTLTRAKELARRAVCSKNLHAIGIAHNLWAEDNGGSLPGGVIQLDPSTVPRCAQFYNNRLQPQDKVQGYWRGEGALAGKKDLAPGALYCPSHEYSWIRVGGVSPSDSGYRGFVSQAAIDGGVWVKHLLGHYRYRQTLGNTGYRPPHTQKDKPKTAVNMDNIASWGRDDDHGLPNHTPGGSEGYEIVYLDGHVAWVADNGGVIWNYATTNDLLNRGNAGAWEFYWLRYFDAR